MSNISMRPCNFFLLVGLSVLIAGSNIQPGYAQTNLKKLQNRVVELEKKLADAKARQEKAYSVQMQLEEQEQALANLAKSDKYRIQIVEIRSDIKNVRTRIEAIIKEKNDLEENLRLAKELQTTLREAQLTANPESKIPTNDQPINDLPPIITEYVQNENDYWQVVNIQVDNSLENMERDEIMNYFRHNRQITEDVVLEFAHRFYSTLGVILRFVIKPKNGNNADLDVLLIKREITGSYRKYVGYIPIMTRSQFKESGFSLSIER